MAVAGTVAGMAEVPAAFGVAEAPHTEDTQGTLGVRSRRRDVSESSALMQVAWSIRQGRVNEARFEERTRFDMHLRVLRGYCSGSGVCLFRRLFPESPWRAVVLVATLP